MKTKFHGMQKVECAFRMAALEHNTDYKTGSLLSQIFGGVPVAQGLDLQEKERLAKSGKKSVQRRKRRKENIKVIIFPVDSSWVVNTTNTPET